MTNILLALLLAVNFLLFFMFFRFLSQLQALKREFNCFIMPEAEGKPSPLASTMQVLTEMMGRSVAASLKAVFMGKASGVARAEEAQQGALTEAAVEQAGFGGLLSSLPGLRKGLRKNPGLLDLALNFLSNRGESGAANFVPGGNGKSSSPQFKL